MKSNVIILFIINLVILIINLIFNLPLSIFFIGLGLLMMLLGITLIKKDTLLLFISFLLIIYSSYLIKNNLNVTTIILILFFVINALYCFKYVLNIVNNKMNIKFNKIVLPNDQEYLVIKYLSGPIEGKNINGAIIKQNDSFKLLIERNDIVNEINILFSDIDSIKIDEKPYFKSTTSLTNYETDYMKSSNIGRYTGDFERVKDFKMIPSYEISINLKNKELIKIISFNKPYIFES